MENKQELTDEQKNVIKRNVDEFAKMCIETCTTFLKHENGIRTACEITLLEIGLHATNNIINEIMTKNEEKGK